MPDIRSNADWLVIALKKRLNRLFDLRSILFNNCLLGILKFMIGKGRLQTPRLI
jgi:hypothetical protein